MLLYTFSCRRNTSLFARNENSLLSCGRSRRLIYWKMTITRRIKAALKVTHRRPKTCKKVWRDIFRVVIYSDNSNKRCKVIFRLSHLIYWDIHHTHDGNTVRAHNSIVLYEVHYMHKFIWNFRIYLMFRKCIYLQPGSAEGRLFLVNFLTEPNAGDPATLYY